MITFPSLYVFNALVGSRLGLVSVLRLLIAALAVTLTVLASFGPIVAFFSVSTTSYPFMVLLNVAMCAAAGFLGLTFLRQTLHRLTLAGVTAPTAIPPPLPQGTSPSGALDRLEGQPLGPHVTAVFRCWMVLFALVGSQMGWVLPLANLACPLCFCRHTDRVGSTPIYRQSEIAGRVFPRRSMGQCVRRRR